MKTRGATPVGARLTVARVRPLLAAARAQRPRARSHSAEGKIDRPLPAHRRGRGRGAFWISEEGEHKGGGRSLRETLPVVYYATTPVEPTKRQTWNVNILKDEEKILSLHRRYLKEGLLFHQPSMNADPLAVNHVTLTNSKLRRHTLPRSVTPSRNADVAPASSAE